jgi:hypothetical protein
MIRYFEIFNFYPTGYDDNDYGDRWRRRRPTKTTTDNDYDNKDGNSVTGDEVDDDGDDDNCGDGRRRGRWRRRDVSRQIATGDDDKDVNGDSTTGNEVDNDGDCVTGDDNDNGDHDGNGGGDGAMGSGGATYPVFEGKQTKNFCNQPIQKQLNNNYFIPELNNMTKHFIPNWKIMIYLSYHATSKEMLAMHVQQTKNATPYKKQ